MKKKLLFSWVALLAAGAAQAGGYQVNLQGQRQIGMGHTGTGLASDAASIFFNPGAMSHLRENGMQLGASGIVSRITYLNPESRTTAVADNPLGTPFTLYAVAGRTPAAPPAEGQPGEVIRKEYLVKFGLGVYTPFGSSVRWGNQWSGRYGLNEIDLSAIFIQPTISLNIRDKIGFGAGFIFAAGGVNLQRSLPLQDQDGREGHVELDGRAFGAGFNAGFYYRPAEKLSFGLTYRSEVRMKVKEGDAVFQVPSSLASRFPNTTFNAELPLPASLTLGIGFRPTEKLTLAADVQRVYWSSYKVLRFDYGASINGSTFSENARNYKDVFIYRIGAEYALTSTFALRAGTYYDNTPVQDGYLTPETPDADAIGISGGFGYRIASRLQLDASFLFIRKKERTDAADKSGGIAGTFRTNAYIPGLALSYIFKQPKTTL